MLVDGQSYKPSLKKFLNQFSRKCHSHSDEQNEYLEKLFASFLDACKDLPDDTFINKKNRRFNIALLEAVFTAEEIFALYKIAVGFFDVIPNKLREYFIADHAKQTLQKPLAMGVPYRKRPPSLPWLVARKDCG
ncbi:MAG: hypothetical protein ABJB21_05360 [bacterium]